MLMLRLDAPLSAPVDPSFYCPSNLKEAIDCILRVTVKDGHDSSGNGSAALTEQVKGLLKEVKGSDSGLGVEIGNIEKALGNGSGTGLIGKLAEGLQQFIGYEGGKLSDQSTPKLTGGGILPANAAKYQVCNAVLNFVIRFLEGLCEIKGVGNENKPSVNTVIGTLRKCVGTGQVPTGLKDLVEKIEGKVDGISKKVLSHPNQGKLKEVFEEFKKISGDFNAHQNQGPKVEANKLDNFLNAVEPALHSDTSRYFATYSDKLKILFGNSELKGKAQQDTAALNYGLLQASIQGVTVATLNLNSDIRSINNTPGKANLIPNAAVFTAVRDAATAFIAELQTKTYTSYYDKKTNPQADWKNVNITDKVQTCAKIFLGCLPLYYQALTYIYWGCHEKGGAI